MRLLAVIGLTLAGGLLLLWVAQRSWRELRRRPDGGGDGRVGTASFVGAMARVVLADISMSLDNVLAVAGAARTDRVSVLLMGAAASVLARLLQRHRWIAFVGLAIVLFVATRMIWDGTTDVLTRTGVTGRAGG